MFRIPLLGTALLVTALTALPACAPNRDSPYEAYQIPVLWGNLDGKPGFHVVFIGDFDKDGAYLVDHDQIIRYLVVNQDAGDLFVADDGAALVITHIAQVVPGDDGGNKSGGSRKPAGAWHGYVLLRGHGANAAHGASDGQILSGELRLADQGTHIDASRPFTVSIESRLGGYVRDDGKRFLTFGQQDLVCRMKP